MVPFIAGHNYYYYIIREIRSDCVIGTLERLIIVFAELVGSANEILVIRSWR